MRIFKDFRFESAHKLPMVPKEHKCHHLHGHNYKLRVELSGPMDQSMGWVYDFAFIEAAIGPHLKRVDHKYLNDIEGLENPTAEIIAEWFLERLRLTILPVSSVTVWETDDCGAIAE